MDYEQFKIKRFDNWDLYLHVQQFPYLGRAYAWARRDGVNEVSQMNSDERDELFDVVIPSWENSMKLFHDKFRTNLAIFGNTSPHLHAHLIPRFETPRQYRGIDFIDSNPTGNYAPYPKKELPLEMLLSIKEQIRNQI